MALIELGQRAVEHRFADDELTDEVHDGVRCRAESTEECFQRRRAAAEPGARISQSRRCAVVLCVCGRVGGLRFENVARSFVLAGFNVAHALDAQFGDDRGNAAALRNAFFGLRCGQSGFDDFHRRGSGVVSGRNAMTVLATMEYMRINWNAAACIKLFGSMRRAML